MSKPRGIVLYDGECPLCRRSVRILKKLDWLGKLDCRDVRNPANVPPCDVALDPQKLIEEMHVVPPSGHTAYAGFAAFRWMAWRMPPTFPITPLLYLPGVPWMGRRIYAWVARNRFKLVPCHDGQCRIPLKPAA